MGTPPPSPESQQPQSDERDADAAPSTTSLTQRNEEESSISTLPSTSNDTPHQASPRYLLGATWVAFMIFSFFLAPGTSFNSLEFAKFRYGDFGDVNTVFFAIIELIGATCINYAVLLNAGAPRQPKFLPTPLFTAAGVLLGFMGLGPYLVLRNSAPGVTAQEVRDRGFISRLLESRWFSVATLLLAGWAYVGMFAILTPGSETLHDLMFVSSLVDLSRLVRADRFVSVACVDFSLLLLLLWGPLTEDMARRGWFKNGFDWESVCTALSILSTPGFGTALYLVLRPSLEEVERREQAGNKPT